ARIDAVDNQSPPAVQGDAAPGVTRQRAAGPSRRRRTSRSEAAILRAERARRDTESVTEQSGEVHRVLEAASERDVGHLLTQTGLGQSRMLRAQTQGAQMPRDGQAMSREDAIEMRARTAEPAGDQLGRQIGRLILPGNERPSRDQHAVLTDLAFPLFGAE